MGRWRRKPIVIEAWQFMPVGQREARPPWIDPQWFYEEPGSDGKPGGLAHMLIPTPGGALRAELTDWIIRGVKGDVYPCKNEVFVASYEPVP